MGCVALHSRFNTCFKLSHSKILRHRRGKLSFSCASFLAYAKVLQNSSHTPTMSTSMGKVHVDSLRLLRRHANVLRLILFHLSAHSGPHSE